VMDIDRQMNWEEENHFLSICVFMNSDV